jgi:hypothetical protein
VHKLSRILPVAWQLLPGGGKLWQFHNWEGQMFRFSIYLFVLACCLIAGCAKKFHGDDLKMMRAAKVLATAIDNYHSDNATWPDTLEQVRASLPAGTPWPVNPYDGKELADTGSPDFDPATSVGMVYYQRTFRDEEQSSYMLHVFGTSGKLYIIGNTAMGAKE